MLLPDMEKEDISGTPRDEADRRPETSLSQMLAETARAVTGRVHVKAGTHDGSPPAKLMQKRCDQDAEKSATRCWTHIPEW